MQGGLVLTAARYRVLELLFAGSLKVVVSVMHGGFSGSQVLKTVSFAENGEAEEPTVTKLDTEAEMRYEVDQTRQIFELVGEGVIEMRGEPVYLEGQGGVILIMAGACWVRAATHRHD